MKDITKHYSNDEITIAWKPAKCIHAAECVKALPKVYNPNEKPWLKMENATTEELIHQIGLCPSGALSYFKNGEEPVSTISESVKVVIKPNGPLLVHGDINVVHADGTEDKKTKITALCRCGHSSNKPFCDGAHLKAGFIG